MAMRDRMMRAKCMMRECLQYMEEGDGKEKTPKKKAKAKNNPFAIANAAKKKRGMSDEATEDMTMGLKKKLGYR